MASSGAAVSETVAVRRGTQARVIAAVRDVFRADSCYLESAPATGSLLYSRAFRPTFGVFAKRTETCAISVSEDRAGINVTVTGRLRKATLTNLRCALSQFDTLADNTETMLDLTEVPIGFEPEIPPAPSVWSTGKPPAASSDGSLEQFSDLLTAVPEVLAQPGQQLPGHVNGLRATLRFEDGSEIRLSAVVVLGRDPKLQPSDGPDAERFVLADTTISKTHLAIGIDARGVWVEDRHSTNGTRIGADKASSQVIESGVKVVVPRGYFVVVGGCVAQLH